MANFSRSGDGRKERRKEGREGRKEGEREEERGKEEEKTNAQSVVMITGLQDDSAINHTSWFAFPFIFPSHSELELALCNQYNVQE